MTMYVRRHDLSMPCGAGLSAGARQPQATGATCEECAAWLQLRAKAFSVPFSLPCAAVSHPSKQNLLRPCLVAATPFQGVEMDLRFPTTDMLAARQHSVAMFVDRVMCLRPSSWPFKWHSQELPGP